MLEDYLFFVGAVIVAGVCAAASGPIGRYRRMRRFEAQLLELRAIFDAPIEYRALRDTDGLGARLLAVEPQLADIATLVRPLGDLVAVFGGEFRPALLELYGGEMRPMLLRVFVDDSGLILADASVGLRDMPPSVSVTVESYSSNDEEWVTHRSRKPTDDVPFIHSHAVPESASLADMISAHRSFAVVADASKRFVTFGSIEDVARMYTRLHNRGVDWRHMQPQHELLRRDLRCIMRDDYETFGGERLARRLQRRLQKFRIPTAQAR